MADKMLGISLQNERAKYMLVAVLVAILLAVVVWPGEATPTASATGPQHHAAPASDPGLSTAAKPSSTTPLSPGGRWTGGAGASGANATANSQAKTSARKLPARNAFAPLSQDELDSTLKFNPFVPSAVLQAQLPGGPATATDQKAQEDLAEKARVLAAEQRLSEFRGKKVRVVFRTADGTSAAIIGEKLLVREGEVIDGIRIVSISHDGVVVEVVPPPEHGAGF